MPRTSRETIKSRQNDVPSVWNYARKGQIPEWRPIDGRGPRTPFFGQLSSKQSAWTRKEYGWLTLARFASVNRPHVINETHTAPCRSHLTHIIGGTLKRSALRRATRMPPSKNQSTSLPPWPNIELDVSKALSDFAAAKEDRPSGTATRAPCGCRQERSQPGKQILLASVRSLPLRSRPRKSLIVRDAT